MTGNTGNGTGADRYRALLDASLDILCILDPEGRVTYVNAAVSRILGHAPEELLGSFGFDLVHPDERPAALARFAELRANPADPGQLATYRMRCRDGSYRHLEALTRNAVGDPAVRGYTIAFRDVSERQAAESARQRADERLRLAMGEAESRRERLEAAVWAGAMGVWEWYPQRDLTEYDARSAELYGLDKDSRAVDHAGWIALLHPDDRDVSDAVSHAMLRGERQTLEFEFRVRDAQGQWRWRLDRGRVADTDNEGRVLRVIGVTLDIDERKRAELEVEERGLQLDLALRASGLGLWDWDLASDLVYVDQRYTGMLALGEHTERFPSAELAKRVHPEDRDEAFAAIMACRENRSAAVELETRMLRGDGQLVHVRLQGFAPRRDEQGRATRMIGTIADITAEDRAAELMRSTHEIARIGGYELRLDTGVYEWTSGMYTLFRVPEDFVPTEESLLSLVAPASRARVQDAMRRVATTGEPFDFEYEARTAYGRTLWVRQIAQAEMLDGQPIRVFGVIGDVTVRHALELELLEAANVEQQRLGHELHDGLGQQLTGMALMLQGVAEALGSKDTELAGRVAQVNEMVGDAIRSTRALAHGLAPVSVRRGGLEEALRVLAADASRSLGCDVRFHCSRNGELRLDEVAGNHLYRITQESLNNAVRHGKAQQVSVQLHVSPDSVLLRIDDDGSGITAIGSAGLGLRGMAYRAQSLNGTLQVLRRPAGGTRVQLECPQPEPAG